MSNVLCVAWRTPCLGLRASSLHPPKATAPFRSLFSRPASPTWPLDSVFRRSLSSRPPPTAFLQRYPQTTKCPPSPSRVPSRSFQSSAALSSKPGPAPVEKGVQLRDKPFSKAEIDTIFGNDARLSPDMGNRVLSVLQARRISGTLDLDLPGDITRAVRPSAIDAGLEYLREHYPLDEDAAILARIEREERAEEEKFIRRAEELGLYKPQSGTFGAELGEGDDPSGRSVLKEMREYNEAKNTAEAERRRQEWFEGEEKEREKLKQLAQKNTALQKLDESALEVRQRADPNERPLLAWIQKHHIEATDTESDISKLTTRDRILPSLALTILALGLCYAFAVTYDPPAKADRMWPNLPPAAATVVAIIGANIGIFVLWKFPPAWKWLNRYFISFPGLPRPFSLVGNVFSHQKLGHLAINMTILWACGTKLHDDIGRGNFLGLYMASGILGSFVSLTAHVLSNRLYLYAFGASGAVAGVVAALLTIHAEQRFTLWFLPDEWKNLIAAQGWVALASIVTWEVVALMFFRGLKVDYWAHLGGYFTGTLWALDWRRKKREEQERNKTFLDRVFSG